MLMEAALPVLLRVACEPIVLRDGRGAIVGSSPSWDLLVGDLTGPDAWLDLLDPDDRPRMEAELAVGRASEVVCAVPVRVVVGDACRWVVGTVAPVMGVDGARMGEITLLAPMNDALESSRSAWDREDVLNAAARMVHVGAWDWNIQTSSLWWSDEVYRIFGLAVQEFPATYEAFLGHVHAGDREEVSRAVQAALDGTHGYDIRHRVVRTDGTVRFVRERGELLRAADGSAVRMLGTVQDVTEQVEAEAVSEAARQELVASETHFRLLAENASDVVLLVAPDDMLTWVSPSIGRMLGWRPDEVLGHRGVEFVHPDDVGSMRGPLSGAYRDEVQDAEYRMRKADGDYRWVSAVSRPAWGPGGDLQGRVVGLRDVHEQVIDRLRLEESEALLRVVLDNTSDAIMRLGPDQRVEYVNRRLADSTGVAIADWMGRTLQEAGLPSRVALAWDESSHHVFATGEPVLREFEIDLPIGRRWFETRVDPEFASDGSVAHVLTTSRDVTQRRLAETELRNSEELLSVILEGSCDATSTYGPDLRFEYVNRRLVELSGTSGRGVDRQDHGRVGIPRAGRGRLDRAHPRGVRNRRAGRDAVRGGRHRGTPVVRGHPVPPAWP